MNNFIKLSLLSLLIFSGQCIDASNEKTVIQVPRNNLPQFVELPNSTEFVRNSIFDNIDITILRTIATCPESNKSVATYTVSTRRSDIIRSISICNNEIVYAHKSRRDGPDTLEEDSSHLIIKQLVSCGIKFSTRPLTNHFKKTYEQFP